MDKEDFIVTVISFLMLIIFVFNPIFRKLLTKDNKKVKEGPPREDPVYESIDSFDRRFPSSSQDQKEIRIIQPEVSVPQRLKETIDKRSVLSQIEKQNVLKKAIIWKEILSPPPALRDPDHLF